MNAQTETTEKVDEAVTGVTNWWNNPDTQEMLIQRPLKILLIIIVALVLNWLARGIIRRATRRGIDRTPLLAPEVDDTPQSRAQEARRQQRMKTLGNVGRSVAAIVIWTWAALAVLDQLGVNVAPLIASAGVVGVVVGDQYRFQRHVSFRQPAAYRLRVARVDRECASTVMYNPDIVVGKCRNGDQLQIVCHG